MRQVYRRGEVIEVKVLGIMALIDEGMSADCHLLSVVKGKRWARS